MKRVPRQHRNRGVRRERDGRALRRQIVLLACGLTVACGFVAAVGQHYAAVRYGYEGERLREERKVLLAERDRLLMELSAAESPVTLERAAREIGMQPARPSQMGTARRANEEAGREGARDAAGERSGASGGRANANNGRADNGERADVDENEERGAGVRRGDEARRGEESKRGEEKLSTRKPAERSETRERVAAQGVGDSRPRVVGQSGAKVVD